MDPGRGAGPRSEGVGEGGEVAGGAIERLGLGAVAVKLGRCVWESGKRTVGVESTVPQGRTL